MQRLCRLPINKINSNYRVYRASLENAAIITSVVQFPADIHKQWYQWGTTFCDGIALPSVSRKPYHFAPTGASSLPPTHYGLERPRLYWGGCLWSLRWRHNDYNGVSNHQPHGCLLNRLFRRRSKKTSKLRVTGLCVGNSPGTGEFPAQRASYAENVSIWWRHHG